MKNSKTILFLIPILLFSTNIFAEEYKMLFETSEDAKPFKKAVVVEEEEVLPPPPTAGCRWVNDNTQIKIISATNIATFMFNGVVLAEVPGVSTVKAGVFHASNPYVINGVSYYQGTRMIGNAQYSNFQICNL